MIGSCFADITSLSTKIRVAKDSSYSCISVYSGEHHRSIIKQQTLNQPQIIQPSQKSFQKTEQGWLLKVDKTIESNKKRGPTSAQARSHKYRGEDLNTNHQEPKPTSTSFINQLPQHSQRQFNLLSTKTSSSQQQLWIRTDMTLKRFQTLNASTTITHNNKIKGATIESC